MGIERLERPFMTFMRNDYLGATPEVVDQACLENGVSRSSFLRFSAASRDPNSQMLRSSFVARRRNSTGALSISSTTVRSALAFRSDKRAQAYPRPSVFAFVRSASPLPGLSIAKAYTTKPSPHRTLLILNTGCVSVCRFRVSLSFFTSRSPNMRLTPLSSSSSFPFVRFLPFVLVVQAALGHVSIRRSKKRRRPRVQRRQLHRSFILSLPLHLSSYYRKNLTSASPVRPDPSTRELIPLRLSLLPLPLLP